MKRNGRVRIPTVARITLACLAIALAATPDRGLCHGDPLIIDYRSTTNSLVLAPTIYDNFNTDENLASLLPGFPITTIYPGFSRASGLPGGSTVRINFTLPLRYWNPATLLSDPLPSPLGTIGVENQATAAALISAAGVTGSNPLTLATFAGSPGEHHHFASYTLTDPDAPGLYGLWAEATATGSGYPGGTTGKSDPFLIILNWGIDDALQYQDGVGRLAASVPEPGPVLWLTVALTVAAVWCARRWRPDAGGHRLSGRY